MQKNARKIAKKVPKMCAHRLQKKICKNVQKYAKIEKKTVQKNVKNVGKYAKKNVQFMTKKMCKNQECQSCKGRAVEEN